MTKTTPTNKSTAGRAPKGGCTIKGVFYKGGQFLPADEPMRGKFNRPAKKAAKVRKVQVAPYKWVENPEDKRAIWGWVAGTVATMDGDKMVYFANEKRLNYVGLTEERARELIARWNGGEWWV